MEGKETDFAPELLRVFNILENNPDDIVDDTAIERLLNLLEEKFKHSLTYELDLLCSIFIQSENVWKHEVTLSFALRLAGIFGWLSNLCNDFLVVGSVGMLFDKTHKHQMFAHPTVQYGFYKGLTLLCKDNMWRNLLFECIPVAMRSFRDFSHHVKKSAVEFMVNLFQSVYLITEDRAEYRLMTMEKFGDYLIKEDVNLEFVLQSLSQLYQISSEYCLTILMNMHDEGSFFLLKGINAIIQNTCQCKDLLLTVIDLLAVLTSSDVEHCWVYFLSYNQEKWEEILKDFVCAVEQNSLYVEQFPMLCESLMYAGKKKKGFNDDWRSFLLAKMINHLNVQEKKLWKQTFAQTVTAMCNVRKKISDVQHCQDILEQWTTYCQKVLLISINAFDEAVDKNLYCVVNDKKVTRLCFQYLQSISEHGKARGDTVECLWKCLSVSTDSHPIICCTLDLITQLVKNDTENFATFLKIGEQSRGDKVADFLALKMWDVSWEVKDSLMSLLIELTRSAKEGSDVCRNFLETNAFWVCSRQFLDDDESYVRAKTITFMTQLYSCKGLWSLFCEKADCPNDSIWIILRDIFNKEGREDDMFTRRSVLRACICLIERGFLFRLSDHSKQDNVDDTEFKDTFRQYLLPILENGSKDFDWEVRRFTLKVWRSLVTHFKHQNPNISDLLRLIGECDFNMLSLCQATLDCELKVKRNALKCLLSIKEHLVNSSRSDENRNVLEETETDKKIETLEDIETYLQAYGNPRRANKQSEFQNFLLRCDLTRLIDNLQESDVSVQSDPLSFLRDIIASTKKNDANLLDCY